MNGIHPATTWAGTTLFVKDVVTLKSFNFDYGIAPLIAAALSP
jgi:hypothetical protein